MPDRPTPAPTGSVASALDLPAAPLRDARARTRGALFMLGSALAFSLMSLCVKLVTAELPAMQVVAARSAFMTAVTLVWLRAVGVSPRGVNRPWLLARAAFGATALSLLYVALGRLPLGDAVTVQNTAPVWAALFATVVAGERLRGVVLASAAASLAGVVLVARPSALFGGGDALDPVGIALVLGAAMFSGLAYAIIRRLRTTDDPLVIILYLSAVGTVGALPFAALGGWLWPSAGAWALLLGIGVATQAGQVAMTRGLHLLDAGTATAVGYVQVVFAFAWGALVFGDVPDGLRLLGAAVIVASVLGLVRSKRSRS